MVRINVSKSQNRSNLLKRAPSTKVGYSANKRSFIVCQNPSKPLLLNATFIRTMSMSGSEMNAVEVVQ
jgi:hypothetical protein